ncbi:flagellar motor protein MotD [Pseudomonas schmalbachii]|uniref:Flagellar motor protein MotD n=1 Tax=Pseudomonas schmalbachii TaxID=2816993 RepID=A0ABS3TQ23_9PSED|nr:flagellar motor protein MotD [Pseudomonas schmalbachii]MBO3275748.1 flagellar motor protein MotD [Pseudomonas schmalbachii]
MARRRHREEHQNQERWLVSYADFITLLFAFFVVMYSISSINEGKYKILSETLTGVFNQPEQAMKAIPIGEERPRTTQKELLRDVQNGSAEGDPLKQIADSVRAAFGDLIATDQLHVRGNEQWIEITLSSSLLFPSGEAIPNEAAFDIIEKVAGILAPYRNPVNVEGFTDNVPIHNARFPTNWELSTARAASIVRLLAQDGVDPGRLAAVGYGEFRPLADNADAEGRARNRRVVLVVSRNLDVRRVSTGAADARQDAGTQPAPQSASGGKPVKSSSASGS